MPQGTRVIRSVVIGCGRWPPNHMRVPSDGAYRVGVIRVPAAENGPLADWGGPIGVEAGLIARVADAVRDFFGSRRGPV